MVSNQSLKRRTQRAIRLKVPDCSSRHYHKDVAVKYPKNKPNSSKPIYAVHNDESCTIFNSIKSIVRL